MNNTYRCFCLNKNGKNLIIDLFVVENVAPENTENHGENPRTFLWKLYNEKPFTKAIFIFFFFLLLLPNYFHFVVVKSSKWNKTGSINLISKVINLESRKKLQWQIYKIINKSLCFDETTIIQGFLPLKAFWHIHGALKDSAEISFYIMWK